MLNRKIVGIFVMTLMIAATVLPVVSGQEQLDQEQDQSSFSYSFYGSRWLGQSFKPTLDTLSKVELLIGKNGAPTTDVVVSIRSTLAGSDLDSVSLSAGSIPDVADWVEFDFDDIVVTPGDTYYIVVRTSSGSSSDCYTWSCGQFTPYTDGAFQFSINSGSLWFEFTNYDFCFRTYAPSVGPTVPVLDFSPSSFDFGDKYEGIVDSTVFDIWNSGTGTLTYSLGEVCGWVDVIPISGDSVGESDPITVNIDTTSLSLGAHNCDIMISSNDGSGIFTVYVNIIPSPGCGCHSLDAVDGYPVDAVYVDNNGYVGIGTTSPISKLEVDGVISDSSGTSNNWNAAFGWGDHSTAGYIDTESDPVFGVSPASGISSGDVSNWNAAFGWGDHSTAGYDSTSDSWIDNGDNVYVSGNTATGGYAIAMGYGTTSSGGFSTAMGRDTTASGYASTAMGRYSNAIGDFSTAMGESSNASGCASTAMGRYSNASGPYSTVMGEFSNASGYASTAMGYETTASGQFSTAMGRSTTANGLASTAMGYETNASGWYSTAMGRFIDVIGYSSFGIGLGYQNPKWTVSDDYVMSIMGGKVGIGTTSPSTILDVCGDISIFGTKIIDSTGKWVGDPSGLIGPPGPQGEQGPPGPIAGSDRQFVYNNGGSAAGAAMFYDNSNVRIGLGIAAPTEELHIKGGGPEILIEDVISGLDTFLRSVGGEGIIGTKSNHPFFIQTAGNYRMSFDTSGNVGIGTTSPNSKLEVAGTVHSTSGGFKFPDNTIQTTAAAATGTGFGEWESKSENTVYLAPTDGFVIAILKRPGGVNDGGGYILGYTDGNNPPTTMRSAVRLDRTYNSAIYSHDEYNSFSMPVKKGDYWRCTYTNIINANSYVRTYSWMPVGE